MKKCKKRKVLIAMDMDGNTVRSFFMEELLPRLADRLVDTNKVEPFFIYIDEME